MELHGLVAARPLPKAAVTLNVCASRSVACVVCLRVLLPRADTGCGDQRQIGNSAC